MIQQAHIYIKGDVVGVGYRAWVKIHSKSLSIKGWIRNNFHEPDIFGPNGGVEAVIQGTKSQIDQMIMLLKRGPSVSYVDEVVVNWEKVTKVYSSFEIIK